MTSHRAQRKSARVRPILVGLATGALVIGVVAVAAPAEELPASSLSASLTETAGDTARGATAGPDGLRADGSGPAPDAPPVPASPTSTPAAAPTDPGAAKQATGAADTSTSGGATTRTAAGSKPAGRNSAATQAPKDNATADDAPVRDSDVITASGSEPSAVVAATNAERKDAGCKALKTDSRLTKSAQGHASDMAKKGYFSHTGKDGRDFADRAEDAGYSSPGGENIAQGQESSAEVVKAWMNSSGHRKNILNCSFTTIGVGHASNGDYWVQVFGR